ncbi:hypothetical protein D3C71_1912510 [compost metagenome]
MVTSSGPASGLRKTGSQTSSIRVVFLASPGRVTFIALVRAVLPCPSENRVSVGVNWLRLNG